jgi:hypothetical protein
MTSRGNLPEALKKAAESSSPDLGLQGPVKAKVVNHYWPAGKQSDGLPNAAPTVDVKVIKLNGKDHPDFPDLLSLEIPSIIGDADGKSFILGALGVGAIVRVAFYELNPTRPYLDAVLGGNTGAIGPEHIPDADPKLYLRWGDARIFIDKDSNIHIRSLKDIDTDASGHMEIQGATVNVGKGATQSIVLGDAFMALFLAHTHMHPLGPTTCPMPPLMNAAEHLSATCKVKP